MKIALGMKLQTGAFGGGNQFGKALHDFLTAKNTKVVFDLKDNDIDVILLTDPRKWLASCAFDCVDVLKYLKIKPDTVIVSRINECDERKGLKLKILNKLLCENALLADKTVFISNWLRQLFIKKNINIENKSQVILNGADSDIFNSAGYQPWNKQEPLRLVTHHWGANWYKGFDVYAYLDQLLENELKNKITFTFIGKLPNKIRFKNIKVLKPLSGSSLADEIKKHHVYLTASINEPAGMHHIEGALCGLPILYRNSGALPEYCHDFGVIFNGPEDFESGLKKIIVQYDYLVKKMLAYEQKAEKMCEEYYRLISGVIENKKKIVETRKFNKFSRLYAFAILKFFGYLLRIRDLIIK